MPAAPLPEGDVPLPEGAVPLPLAPPPPLLPLAAIAAHVAYWELCAMASVTPNGPKGSPPAVWSDSRVAGLAGSATAADE